MLAEGLLAPAPPLRSGRRAESWLTSRPRTLSLAGAGVVLAALAGGLVGSDPKLGVAVVGTVALIALVLLRPFFGGLILVGLVPVVSGLAPGVPVSSVRISEALIGVVGVTLIVSVRRRDAVPWGLLDWLVLAYGIAWFAFGAADAVVLGQHLTISEWGTVLGQLQFFLIYRGVRISVRSQAERRAALTVALLAAGPVALLAVLQEAHVPGVANLLHAVTGSAETAASPPGTVAPLSITDVHRATGPFPNWTSLAGYLFPLLLTFCAIALARQVGPRRWIFLGVVALALGGLLASEEQSAIIGLAAGAIALGVMTRQLGRVLRWLLVAAVAAGLLFGSAIGKRVSEELSPGAQSSQSSVLPQTLQFRWEVWTGQYVPAIEQRPLTGYGDVTPPSVRWPYTESQYVTLLMEGGLPLLLLFGALTWAMVRRGRACARSPDPMDQALGRALVVSVVALAIMDVVWPFMSNGGLPQVLWALLALAEPCRGPSPVLAVGGTGAALRQAG